MEDVLKERLIKKRKAMKNKKGTFVYTRKVKAGEIITEDDIKFIKDKKKEKFLKLKVCPYCNHVLNKNKCKACGRAYSDEELTMYWIDLPEQETIKYDCCGIRVKLTTPKDAVDPHMQKRINIYRECGSWELAETSINFEILRKALRGVS